MNVINKCSCCGGTQCVSGSIRSTGKAYFKPDGIKFAVSKTSSVSVTGFMCLDCGFVGLKGDMKKARALVNPT